MNMLEITLTYEKVRKGDGPLIAPNGRSYQQNLMVFVVDGLIDQEKAQLAVINGTKRRASIVLRNIQEGHEYVDPGTGNTYRQELRQLVNKGYVDQEYAHLVVMEGKKK